MEYSLVCDTAPPVDAASAEAATQQAAQRLSEEAAAAAAAAAPEKAREEADLAALKKARDEALKAGWAAQGKQVSGEFMQAAASAPTAAVPEDFDASEWVSAVDEATGKTYYYNSKTGASSWVWPPV